MENALIALSQTSPTPVEEIINRAKEALDD